MKSKAGLLYMAVACVFLLSGSALLEGHRCNQKPINKLSFYPRERTVEISENNTVLKVKEDKLKDEKAGKPKIAYITIDDGPSRNNTAAILDILKKYGVKATFFVLPNSNMHDVYKRIISEGHAIGNHSYSHSADLYFSMDYFKRDVIKAKTFMYENFNYTTKVFRFPGGARGRKRDVIQKRGEFLRQNGYRYFDWDVSVADTDPNLKNYGDKGFIVRLMTGNILNNAKGKDRLIILMHDDPAKIYTPQALPHIIEGLKNRGYVFDMLTNYRE